MRNQKFVIKCGGSTLAALPSSFYQDLHKLQTQGRTPVIVHGGGPAISGMLDRLGIASEFINGLRKTSEAVLDVVEMVLAGQINKEVVRRIQSTGARALGLSGTDCRLIIAEAVSNWAEVGFVGDVTHVNAELIEGIAALGYIPVIAPIGLSQDGQQRYNINADTAAGAIASQLGVDQMIVVTDVPGVLKTEHTLQIVLTSVTRKDIEAMIDNGEIYGGMIPKMRAALQCIQGNVQEVVIVNGTEPGVLSRVLAGEPVGTRIIR